MDQQQLDMIRQANNIVDVIGGYIPLKKSGANYKGVCPFHNDTNPSMMVSEPKQIFKCFACGKAGNVITFVQDYEKISFMEAVKQLAERAGIIIEERQRTKVVSTKRELLVTAYKLARDYYKENLKHYPEAMEYLTKREVSPEAIDLLDIGYALNSFAGLKNYLSKMEINGQIMQESGLFGSNNQGTYDLFRERLIFPIHAIQGDVVAFGGRIMHPDQAGGKYINSPTTELYTKGKELYGLHRTRYEISKADTAIICEGYMDFLRLYSAGFHHCAATLGTSFTEEQIVLLSRYSKNVVMLYDGDLAGRKAALRAGLLLLQKGLNPKLAILPADEDPDSFLLHHGAESLKTEIGKAVDVVSFLVEDQSLEIAEREKISLLTDAARQMKDEISRELLLKHVAESFRISESALRKKQVVPKNNAVVEKKEHDLQRNWEEKILLALMLHDENSYKRIAETLTVDYFLSERYRDVYRFISQLANENEIKQPSSLLDRTEDETMRGLISDLMLTDVSEFKVEEFIQQIQLQKYQAELKDVNHKIRQEPENRELFREKSDIIRKISGLSKKVVSKTLQ